MLPQHPLPKDFRVKRYAEAPALSMVHLQQPQLSGENCGSRYEAKSVTLISPHWRNYNTWNDLQQRSTDPGPVVLPNVRFSARCYCYKELVLLLCPVSATRHMVCWVRPK
jgi:hypothetical protein